MMAMIDKKLTRCGALASVLIFATLSYAEAGTAPPAQPSPNTGTFAGVAAHCAPGQDFNACVEALEVAELSPTPSRAAPANSKIFFVKLAVGPYHELSIKTARGANGRITQLQLTANLSRGAERKPIVAWFKSRIKDAKLGEAQEYRSAYGCGVASSGPAWSSSFSEDPEIQLALNNVPWLKPPTGKPMEPIFIKTPSDEDVSICFLLPHKTDSGQFIDQPAFSQTLAQEFLRDKLH